MKKMIRQIARRFGYDVVGYTSYNGMPEPERPWEEDDSFLAAYAGVAQNTVLDRKRLFMLYQLVKAISMDGSIAECGVYRGGTALLFARFKQEDRRLYLFDTFDGMPSVDSKMDLHHQGDFSDTSLSHVQELLGGYQNVIFRPGRFPATASGLEHETFSLAHCDMDIHTSVRDFCSFFYPRLVRGGVMVFDDYGFRSCPGAKAAVREFCEQQGIREFLLLTGQAIVWKL